MTERASRAAALAALGLAGAVALGWLERRRALRRRVEPVLPHTARNLVVAGVSAVAVQLAERPLVRPPARVVERRRSEPAMTSTRNGRSEVGRAPLRSSGLMV